MNATLQDVSCPRCGDTVHVRAQIDDEGHIEHHSVPRFTCNCNRLSMVTKQQTVFDYELDQLIQTSGYERDS